MIRTIKAWLSVALLRRRRNKLPDPIDYYINAQEPDQHGNPTSLTVKFGYVLAVEAWLNASNQLYNARLEHVHHYDGRSQWPDANSEWKEAVGNELKAYEILVHCIESIAFPSKDRREIANQKMRILHAMNADEQTLLNDEWKQLRTELERGLFLATGTTNRNLRPWRKS